MAAIQGVCLRGHGDFSFAVQRVAHHVSQLLENATKLVDGAFDALHG
jgi:hypothetical protein